MEKEKPLTKPKRMRADRVRVRCLCCNQELNKDGLGDHYTRKHQISRKDDQKFVVVLPESQPKLTDFKGKSGTDSFFVGSKDYKLTGTQQPTDLKSPKLVEAVKKPKLKTFLGLPSFKSASPKVDKLKQIFENKIPDYSAQTTIRKQNEDREGQQEQVDKLFRNFEASIIRPVLDKLKNAKSVKEQEVIFMPWEEKLKEFQDLAVIQTPVKWNTNTVPSYKDKTLPEIWKDKIGVAQTGAGGDCQFKAISQSLFGTESLHCGLRLLAAKELLLNKPSIEAIATNVFSERNFDSIFDRVLSYGKHSGWGNETTKYLMSNILQRPIIVTSTDIGNKNTAWMQCRNVRYNANPAVLNKEPIHLLLEGQHYDAILKKSEGEEFVDIQKCQNMHTRLSKAYDYIKPGTDEDEDKISLDTLTEWKKATQWDEFYSLQNIKYAHLVDKGKKPFEIEQILKEDENAFRIRLSEQVKDVVVEVDLVAESDSGQLGKRKRSPEIDGSSTCSPENVYLPSPEKLSVHSLVETTSENDTKMSFDEENEKVAENSEAFGNILKEIKTDVAETRLLLQKLVLNGSRKPLNLETAMFSSRVDTVNLENVASVEDLLISCPWLVYYKEEGAEEDFTGLRCSLCFTSNSSNKEGQFSYSSEHGTDFSDKTQPQRFRNLKNNVKVHMSHGRHRELARLQATRNKLSLKQRQTKTGMILGSLAYESIKMDHSYDGYEGKVAAAASRGDDVGVLNHGSDFCRKFSDCIYTTIQERIKTKLEQPLPGTNRRTSYSLVGDKYTATETRSAGQIVGIITFVDGKIVDIMAEDKRVRNWKGEALAEDIVSSVSNLIPMDIQKQRCVGGCFDGQYLHDGVHNYLMAKMPGKETDKKLWYTFEWDPAHLIERGILDAKTALPKSAKLTKVHSIVHQVNAMFTSGKSYVQMQETAEEHEQRLYAPIQSSPTRFANNEHKALLNFSRNYNLIRDRFSEENVIQNIEHFGFVAALNFQIDLYHEISKLSGNVQQPGKPGWRIDDNVKQTFETIRQMVNSLPDSNTSSFSLTKNLPNLAKAVDEMEKTQTFRGVSVIFSKMNTRASRGASDQSQKSDIPSVLTDIRKEATTFLNAFENGYINRKTKYKASASAYTANLTEAAFSLDNMLANCENQHVPEEFKEYYQLSKRVGFLETDLDDMEIYHQYRRLTYFVKEEYDRAISVRGARDEDQEIIEQRIYKKIFTTNHEDEMDVAADLYLSALLRTKAESVAESMGSIVKAVSASRPNLEFEQLSRDSFTCYNGPETYAVDAPKMIEQSINKYFVDNTQSGEWHFHRKTAQLSKLEDWKISGVVDRKRKEAAAKSKFSFDS